MQSSSPTASPRLPTCAPNVPSQVSLEPSIAASPGSPVIDPDLGRPRAEVLGPMQVASAALDIALGTPWSVDDVGSYFAEGQSRSQAFQGLMTAAHPAGAGTFTATHEANVRSSVRLSPEGGQVLVLASHDAPNLSAMKVMATKLLSDLASCSQLESLRGHYMRGGPHAEPSSPLAQDEAWLAGEFGCGENEARYVAAGLQVAQANRERAVEALHELQGVGVLPRGDEAVERFVSTVRDPGQPSEIARHLIDNFRRSGRSVADVLAPSNDEVGLSLRAFCEQAAGLGGAYGELSREAIERGLTGLSVVDRPGREIDVLLPPQGGVVFELPRSLGETGSRILLVNALASLALRPTFTMVQARLEAGFYHAPDVSGPHGEEARSLAAAGHGVGAAEYAATGLGLVTACHRRATQVLRQLQAAGLVRSDGELEAFCSRYTQRKDSDEVVDRLLADWQAAGPHGC